MQPLTKTLSRLWYHLNPKRRRQFSFLLILMTLSSVAEFFSIASLLPFLAILTSPINVFTHPTAQTFIQILGLTKPEQLILPLTFIFSFFVLISSAIRLLTIWANTRLSFSTGADLGINIYRRTLYQPYAVHVARNSSEIISSISSKVNIIAYSIIGPLLIIINSIIMIIGIFFVLLSVNFIVTLIAFSGFGLIYAIIIKFTRKRLLIGSQQIANESTQVIKLLQEGLGGIRDVLIDGSQSTYCQIYTNAEQSLRRAQGNNDFISTSPRFVVEALGTLLIAGLAYMLTQQSQGVAKAIPVLGVLVLGAQRLLPLLQQAYGAWSCIQGGRASLQDVLELLDQPLPDYANQSAKKTLPFKKQINLNQISFRYSSKMPWVLTKLDLTIAKGSQIGFIGTTGSGKSTLLDIIMGLLHPTEGSIKVDGQLITIANHQSWQAHIAHVPQTIFLADSTIEENIAFSVPKDKIDHNRVRLAACRAQIADTIEAWPLQYKTFVGERGIQLSGGQRQRIGIARAFYKQADVIIFDEATSALDNETELAVTQAIADLSYDLTILIIAHRMSTLKNCNQIVELNNGRISRIGDYETITSSLPLTRIEK